MVVIQQSEIKLLYINLSDIQGGAAIGGYRLHKALLDADIASTMLVKKKITQDDTVHEIKYNRALELVIRGIGEFFGLNELGGINSFRLNNLDLFKESNIVNLHCMHGNYFNYLSLPKLTTHKPIVYKLSDMWTFTGHCAYSFDCHKWQMGCGKCPYPETYPAINRDNTILEWKLKNWVYKNSNLSIVCPSKWLTNTAKLSILNRFPIYHIPNGINTQDFMPLDFSLCRQVLKIPFNKKVLLFGAQSLKDRRKGADLLLKALQKLPQSLRKEIILLTFGDGGEYFQDMIDIPVMCLGYISGDQLKSLVYSAADLFLFSTRADNLPLVLQESMACGTPIVSFNVGGVPDLVRPGITGELAEPENPQDFALKIVELLEDNDKRAKLSQNCRQIAETEYPIELQAQRYIELYQHILS